MSDLTILPVTVEHHREPVGIGETTPRLSWVSRTDLADWRQAAYELEIAPSDGEAWTSGRVDSAESVLLPWEAPELASRERRTVRRSRLASGGAPHGTRTDSSESTRPDDQASPSSEAISSS